MMMVRLLEFPFYVIAFDNLSQSIRCNPLDPAAMHDITDATESARAILLGLNREWINKQGDFFVESLINFLTSVIWFLRRFASTFLLLVTENNVPYGKI